MSVATADERVLIVAPAGRDGRLLADALARAGVTAMICDDVSNLLFEMADGVGVVVVTEEAFDQRGVAAMRDHVAAQPPWSDVPILVLMSGRTTPEERLALATFESLGNATMLHRPVSMVTFISTVRSALRTRRRQYEIRGYVAELTAKDRAKDEFLAMLGHELRNPLSAVRNAVATAALDEGRRARALEIARRQVHQLGIVVDDLLDVARITHGHIALKRERISLSDVLERAIESVRPAVEERGHRLEVITPVDSVHLLADAGRLEQIVVNLVLNAAKYTNPGGAIDVLAERAGDDVRIAVRDNGIGIEPDLLPRVFDLFVQAERGLDRAQGGLGIGLTVAQHLTQLHGGDIEARSSGVGRGATFVVHLPALPGAADDRRAPERAVVPAPARARVLIVEDNPDAAESLVMLLEILGHRVRMVHDGPAAIDAARANRPDLMLIDIGLPGMDGYEVARTIRREPGLQSMLLIALTGYGKDEDKASSMAAGFDYHLVKPVDLDALGDLIGRVGASERRDDALH